MTIWIGGVHLPEKEFRFIHESSDTWLRMRPHAGSEGYWELAANIFENGTPLLSHPIIVGIDGVSVPESASHPIGARGNSWIVLEPLIPNQLRHPSAPLTGPHDFCLIVRACDRSGKLRFEFTESKITSDGMLMEVFGEHHLPPEWPR